MDLAPTFLEAGGVKPPDGHERHAVCLDVLQVRQKRPGRSDAHLGRHRPRAPRRRGPRGQPALPARAPCARRTSCTSATSRPTAGRWAIQRNVTATQAPSASRSWEQHLRRLRRHGRQPDQGLAGRAPQRAQVEAVLRPRLRQTPAEELYDLNKDPDQMKNVAAEADYASEKKRLAEQLMDVLKKAGDPRVRATARRSRNLPSPIRSHRKRSRSEAPPCGRCGGPFASSCRRALRPPPAAVRSLESPSRSALRLGLERVPCSFPAPRSGEGGTDRGAERARNPRG